MAPSRRVTVLPASAVPARVGRVTLVRPSLAVPLSVAAASAGAETAGAAVSMVRLNGAEGAEVVPAALVTVAVRA